MTDLWSYRAPHLEIVSGGQVPAVLARLIQVLGKACRVRASGPGMDKPDARIGVAYTSTQVRSFLETADLPSALWVAGDQFSIEETEREASASGASPVLIFESGARRDVAGAHVVNVSPNAQPLGKHAPVAVLVRSRWRRSADLKENFTVRIGVPRESEISDVNIASALAVAAGAVVSGAWLPVALMLGTPLVTDASSFDALGPDAEGVCVVADEADTDAALRTLIERPDGGASFGRNAHRFAQRHFDLDFIAADLMGRFGFPQVAVNRASYPGFRITQALGAMNTPLAAPITKRAVALCVR